MYPTLYHFFSDTLGVEWHWARLLNSFGFFVALAFIAASYTLSLELRRRTQLGQFRPEKRRLVTGKGPDWTDVAIHVLLGFFFGWKILYLLLNSSRLFGGNEPAQVHLFSSSGYPVAGALFGLGMGLWRWWTYRKQQLPEPREQIVDFQPWEYTGTITFYAAIFGLIGAKLFHLLENPRELISFFTEPSLGGFLAGLTVYGGLILGAAGVIFFAWRKKMNILYLADSIAPGLMLAYGIGRIGCHVSGDGDWGIANPNPKPDWLSWLPDSLWAYDYPNNVNGVGEPLTNGVIFEGYGTHLVPPVFPTPVYETTMAVIIFLILWRLRKKMHVPGAILGFYLVLNGLERFMIEQIRVNQVFDFLGMRVTQAEVISVLFFTGGLLLLIWCRMRKHVQKPLDETIPPDGLSS
ncbi:MAG: prolipoprotein diacylglyceryl transferase [Flavobacteriales bacterium]|jgi:prolipoprotein diacylglyceryltransferase